MWKRSLVTLIQIIGPLLREREEPLAVSPWEGMVPSRSGCDTPISSAVYPFIVEGTTCCRKQETGSQGENTPAHGRHVLNRYEDGMEKCIGCELCAGVCPAKCIYVRGADNDPESPTSPGERFGFVYEINYLRCIHCDLCVEACPTEAITETKLFEFSFTSRQDAIYTKKELLVDDDGRPKQLPWEDWRDGEDDLTSGWMRATSPSGDATFRGVVGWSNELGHGERAPEPPQPEADR